MSPSQTHVRSRTKMHTKGTERFGIGIAHAQIGLGSHRMCSEIFCFGLLQSVRGYDVDFVLCAVEEQLLPGEQASRAPTKTGEDCPGPGGQREGGSGCFKCADNLDSDQR